MIISSSYPSSQALAVTKLAIYSTGILLHPSVVVSHPPFSTSSLKLLEFHGEPLLEEGTEYEPHREKTGFLHLRKQRRRSASRFRALFSLYG